MNADRRRLLQWLAATPLLAPQAGAQSFAGLGSDAKGFALPRPDPVFSFPRDHAAHPAFRIEWWYVTAILDGEDGARYGIQWTLFRSALAPEERPGWASPQVWFAHAGLTTAERHFVGERLARGGIGQAGVQAAPFEAWIDDWSMRSRARGGEDAFDALDITARGPDFSYALALDAEGPLVFQGRNGFSVKSASGQASYYYAQPFYRAQGMLALPEGDVPVRGRAWLDREWSSQPLAENQSGWDWFSLHLDSGAKVMAFRLRDDGAGFRSGNWIAPDGTNTPLGDAEIAMTPLAITDIGGIQVPTEWRLQIFPRGLDIPATPLNPRAWMGTNLAYWEGPITFTGTHPGRGYLEMTGYD
jgi:predicted secreted hydrolase